MSDNNLEKIEKIAHDILMLSRNTLLVNLRFLDNAISQFTYIPFHEGKYCTDGKYMIYNPRFVLMSYSVEKEIPVRDYLHMMMHCIFQHMFGAANLRRDIWDLACDIAVEVSITDLDLKAVSCRREQEQTAVINELKKNVKILTAEKIYRYYLDKNYSEQKINSIHHAFDVDVHEIWYMPPDQAKAKYGISDGSGDSDDNDGNSEDKNENGSGTGNGNGDDLKDNSEAHANTSQQQIWKDIAEHMQMDMETFSKRQGTEAGGMLQNLSAINREKYDYTAFLKKFAVMGEAMKINDDEFDYIYYTYGLKLYDKVPLIEPLEYKEVKRIKEFVVAIDTSGSTSGELVQKFIQKTYNILKSTESFFSKINLHIIQCDADIQEHVKITKQEEFDEYLKTMKIKGLGGTDFRPVFSMVDNLIKNREFTNLKGLIYFTDGYGNFPARKPDYETAFVFVDDEYNNPDIPSWAIKLVLQKDEV